MIALRIRLGLINLKKGAAAAAWASFMPLGIFSLIFLMSSLDVSLALLLLTYSYIACCRACSKVSLLVEGVGLVICLASVMPRVYAYAIY